MLSLTTASANETDEEKPYVLAVVNSFGANVTKAYYDETIQTIEKALAPRKVVVKHYNQDDFLNFFEHGDVDLTIASSGLTSVLLSMMGGTPLLSMVSAQAPDPNRGAGGVIVTRADRSDIKDLEDLQGKRLSVMSRYAFSGFLIPREEIRASGYNPDLVFKTTRVVGTSMAQVLHDIKDGTSDVGFIVTCLLENLPEESDLKMSDFKVIHEKKPENFYCKTSTELYPGWLLSVGPNFPVAKARDLMARLMDLRPSGTVGLEWTVTSDFKKMNLLVDPVKNLYSDRKKLMWVFEAYRWPLTILFLLFVALLVNSFYVARVVRKRTTELKQVMEANMQTEIQNQRNVARIESLQKACSISLISSMVAHDLKQPLAVIVNYAQGIERRLQKGQTIDSETLKDVIGQIGKEGERAADIVETVRGYGKGHVKARVPVDLVKLVEHVLQMMHRTGRLTAHYGFKHDDDIVVEVDKKDIEIVLINLIKNACEAMENVPVPLLDIELIKTERDAVLTVSDNGPQLSAEMLERLGNIGESSKNGGLGLGLAIVRQLIEAVAGSLKLSPNKPNGLTATVKIPLVKKAVVVKDERKDS